MTMFSPCLPLTVYCFLVMVSSFMFAISTRVILHYSRILIIITLRKCEREPDVSRKCHTKSLFLGGLIFGGAYYGNVVVLHSSDFKYY